jgi:hypothetical protein
VDAESFAAELNIEYNATGHRPRTDIRRVKPAKRVEVKVGCVTLSGGSAIEGSRRVQG